MKIAPLVVGLSLLCGCKDVKRDPALVELTAPPLRAVLRAHEADLPVQCNETGLKRVTCWFKSERRGCLLRKDVALPPADRARPGGYGGVLGHRRLLRVLLEGLSAEV